MTAVNEKPEKIKQIEYLCNIRTAARELLDIQKTPVSDDKLLPFREELNRLYDNYKAKYGVLSDDSVKKLFGKDTDYALLKGLEKWDKVEEIYNKADIFYRRTVNALPEINTADSIEEALQISIDKRGKPDIHYIATLLDINYPELSTKEVAVKVYNELLEKGLVFRDPNKTLPDNPYSGIVERSEYLSGNVRQKLTAAESNMQKYGDTQTGLEYKRNVEALKKVIPEDIKAENISVRMSVPWIDSEDYTKFIKHLAGRSNNAANGEVAYSKATGEFNVTGARAKNRQSFNFNENSTYGTKDFSLYALAEKSLNQRQIVIKVERPHPDDPSKTVMKTDHKATKMALEKARLIKDEFKKWIFSDDQRRNKYERKYNDIFNCLVGREYDGSKLTFPGMISDFIMREHQKNAVARTTLGGNSLIAHVVGAGKSAVIFASVMRKKELGLIDKACVVVPKALTEQIAKEWRHLYPEARLLNVSNDDLSNENKRKLFTAKVATGSYDAVILSREQFEKIPMSLEHRISFMRKELDQVEDMLRERKSDKHGRGDPTICTNLK